jgi:hypothetical protein
VASVNSPDIAMAGSSDLSEVGDCDPYIVSAVESARPGRRERRLVQEVRVGGRRQTDPHESGRRRTSLLRSGS